MSIITRKKKAIAALTALLILTRKRQRENRRLVWRKPWNGLRNERGLNCNLLKELEVDTVCFRRYIRMDPQQFAFLLERVAPLIERQNTNFHSAITSEERLALTLRFLSTGWCWSFFVTFADNATSKFNNEYAAQFVYVACD